MATLKSEDGVEKPQEVPEARASGFHLPTHGHNVSSQQNVSSNPDLALHYSHEHQHAHLHHHTPSQAQQDEVVYSNDDERSKLGQTAQGSRNASLRKTSIRNDSTDPEKGVSSDSLEHDDGQHKTKKQSFYSKYIIFFHGFFQALMTGYVLEICLDRV